MRNRTNRLRNRFSTPGDYRHPEERNFTGVDNRGYHYQNGNLHREDGPASPRITPIQGADYYLWGYNGNGLNFAQWCAVLELSLERIVELGLEYGENFAQAIELTQSSS